MKPPAASDGSGRGPTERDWLVEPGAYPARATLASRTLVLDNGLVRREIALAPNAATVSLKVGDAEQVRAVKPEARLVLDGRQTDVGGLAGQADLAFLPADWPSKLRADPAAFRFRACRLGRAEAPFPYKPCGAFPARAWPAPGASATLEFDPPEGRWHGLELRVCYELYDGLPCIGKWVEVVNHGELPVKLDGLVTELLGPAEAASSVNLDPDQPMPPLTVLSEYAFGGDSLENAQPGVKWVEDPHYTTQVDYALKQKVDLVSGLPMGPGVVLAPGDSFAGPRSYLLLHDSAERERKGLTVRRCYEALAPWVRENPLMLHLTSVEPAVVRQAIDQAADVGFELVIFSFGSGLDMEDVSPANLAKFRGFSDYAHAKGLMVGGYSLLASRRISPEDDVVDPKTGKPDAAAIFGASPCLGSKWAAAYFDHLKTFLVEAGFDMLEHDGSYPGDVCASTSHPGHAGLEDSQWRQWQTIATFYRWCRGRGIFLNVPDWYFLAGSNKTGMGYRETNWSLPRADQVIHARQNMYDGTWTKAPTMGWMFVPLVEYQGGGAAATIEPLREHLQVYEQHLTNCLGFGVQACYRGPRLYDAPETRAMVARQVAWFKAHRAILEADVVHLRRADGRDWDGVLHVDASLPVPALAVFYNPTARAIERDFEVPLRLAGLAGSAMCSLDGAPQVSTVLDADGRARVRLAIPASGFAWASFARG